MTDFDSIPLWLLFMVPLYLVGLIVVAIGISTTFGGRTAVFFLIGCGLGIILNRMRRKNKARTSEQEEEEQ